MKFSIEARNIFDSILISISNNVNNNNLTKIKKIKPQYESKLTIVLNSICFDKNISNIKFRIIGNTKLIKGYNQNTKDVLIFLYDCWKILNCQFDEDDNDIDINDKNNINNEKFNSKINSQKIEINIVFIFKSLFFNLFLIV